VRESTETTLRLDPQHDGAYHALALWHLEVPWIAGGRTSQVRPNFEQAIAIKPSSIGHRLQYGKALLRLNDPEAAKTMLESALSLSAITFADREDQAEAQEILEQEF
jgi:Tfp pilus assembly protein PilF